MEQKETDDIERRRLAIEEEKLHIERSKVELEVKKAAFDQRFAIFEQRFASKHLPTFVTAILSVTAVIVSGVISYTQLTVAQLEKDRELTQQKELASIQLRQQAEQHRLDWSVKIAEFVTGHTEELLSSDEPKRNRIRSVIDVSFPADIRIDIFSKLYEAAPNKGVKSEWQAAAQKAAEDIVWTKQDALGKLYSETFAVTTENRHGRPDIIASGSFSISTKSARIYDVRYSCSDPRCERSYNPDSAKGYGIDYTLSPDQRSFTWRRKWDGDTVKETYTALIEVSK